MSRPGNMSLPKCERPQGESLCDRSKLTPARNSPGIKTVFKDLTNCRHQGRPAGQEHAVYILRGDARRFQQPIHTATNPVEIGVDPFFECRSLNPAIHLDHMIVEEETSHLLRRQLDFHRLNRLMEVEPEIVLDDVQEGRDSLRIQGLGANASQHFDGLARLQE